MKVIELVAALTLAASILAHPLAAQADGATVYKKECKSCHGFTGIPPARAKAQYKKIKAVGEGGFVSNLSTDSIVTILKNGISKDMKSFAKKLNEEEIQAVATYMKELAAKKEDS